MLYEYDGYCASPLAQIIFVFIIALILSWCAVSLVLVISFALIMECIVFSMYYCHGKWSLFLRTTLIFASIAGWIVGRSLFKMESYFISDKHDRKRNLKCIGRK